MVNGEIEVDRVSPRTRTVYVTNQEECNEVFSTLKNVDFNTQMVVIFLYTSTSGRKRIVKNVYVDEEGFLNIEFDIVDGKPGYNDASMPKTIAIALRMKNVWKDKVKFTYLS